MAETRFCERCQRDVPRIGVHACVKFVPDLAQKTAELPVISQKLPSGNAADNATPNPPAAKATPNTTPNIAHETTPNKAGRAARDKRYREAHQPQRSTYMRDYMKKYREASRT